MEIKMSYTNSIMRSLIKNTFLKKGTGTTIIYLIYVAFFGHATMFVNKMRITYMLILYVCEFQYKNFENRTGYDIIR